MWCVWVCNAPTLPEIRGLERVALSRIICYCLSVSTTPGLSEAVGRGIRELRDKLGVTADRVAAEARAFGLSWQRSTVASIETGRRALKVEELLLLPLVLSGATGEDIRLCDLLEAEVVLSERVTLKRSALARLVDKEGRQINIPGRGTLSLMGAERMTEPRSKAERERLIGRAAAGDTEQTAARALGVTAAEVARIAHRLWGRSLTDERDRRLNASATSDDSPLAARSRRGHITRALLEEIRLVLDRRRK
jgi:transcriptional regulator with XRE-family HTH domain